MPGLRGFELAEDDLPDCRSTAGERAHNVGRFHAIQQTYLQSSQNDLSARAPQAAMPSVGFVTGRSAEVAAHLGGAFHKGLNETGYAEGQNVVVEYHWLRPIRSKSSCSIRVDHAGGGVPADREAAA